MARDPSEPESGLDCVAGIIILLFWSALLVEGLGITIIVGITDISPRSAALALLAPALLVWIAASSRRSLRQFAVHYFWLP